MVLYSVIIFAASLIQGMTGFGFSLIAMPILAMFMPLKIIVPILVVCSLGLNLIIFFRLKGQLHLKRILMMLVIGIASTSLGVQLLTVVDEVYLKAGVGILIILSSIVMFKGLHVEFKSKQLTYAVTGFLSGVLNGSVSLSGPPVVLMLVNEGTSKNDFKKNISAFFLALNIFTIPSFLAKGLVTSEVIKLSGIGMVVIIVGALIGIHIGEGIREEKFKSIVLGMIALMGCMTLVSIF